MSADSALDRIGQISMRVHDIERATRFYRDALGLRLLFSVSGMSFFQAGDVRLMLSPVEELSPVFVAGLGKAASRGPAALFFDTYEQTSACWVLGG